MDSVKEIVAVIVEIGIAFLIASKYIDTKFQEVEDKLRSFDSLYDKRCDELEAYVRRVEAVSEVNRRNSASAMRIDVLMKQIGSDSPKKKDEA